MTVNIGIVAVIAFVSLLIGFMMGRSVRELAKDTEVHVRETRKIPQGQVVASPVSGEVNPHYVGNRYGALIKTEQEKVFAPVSGQIKKIYPMGKAMLIATNFGAEILVEIGEGDDELCSMYYRSRVMPNEMITKGKLLMEFDREALRQQGVDSVVSVTVEALQDNSITVTQHSHVKTGDALLWV